MQDWPLTVDKILDHARAWHGETEIVSRDGEGRVVRSTYAEVHGRARQVSNALLGMGVGVGDRVATLAWNGHRHLEVWYGIMGMGAVCHTLNPRLHPDQLAYIIGHAGDRVIFVDEDLASLVREVLPRCPSVERVVVMSGEGAATAGLECWDCYEGLIRRHGEESRWGGFPETAACGLCYTSGTTGQPKGVLYSHRSNFLHTYMMLQPDVLGCASRDTILMVVPMFHANAWGLAFAAPAIGAKLVLPGPRLDPASIHDLLESEGCTFAAAVPTIWQGLLQHLRQSGRGLTSLKRVAAGGAAVPEDVVKGFRDEHGVEVVHTWGMTELSPIGVTSSPGREAIHMGPEARMACRLKQGRPPLGVELKLVGQDGGPQPHDGASPGRLQVRGPWVARAYYRARRNSLEPDGFFDTGDIATVDRHGFMQIVDRAKDIIKSGGEWISSQAIEVLTMRHPKVALAAVVGIADPKWGERPRLVVTLKAGETATPADILAWLDGKIARWWTPDAVDLVDSLPMGPTGKIDKARLRQRFQGDPA